MSGVAEAHGATALLEEAARLDLEARQHKRAANQHRRLAQQARQRIEEIEATCRALGIRFVIHDTAQPPKEAQR